MYAFCTVVTSSHYPYVLALHESLRASGNREELHVLMVGSPPPAGDAESGLIVLGMDDLQVDVPAMMPYYYSAFEMCNALKPFLVSHLIGQDQMERVIFLDSDLLITDRFERVWQELDSASLLLTPHHYSPPALGSKHTNEVDVIDLGYLNGGFAGWRKGPVTTKILQWMRERFAVYGFYRYLGMAADQKLLPLLLAYFPDDVKMLRDPGLNIAYWNAHERSVTEVSPDHYEIEGRSVVFFHMSGCKPSHPGMPCAYISDEANAELLTAAPWLKPVVAHYQALLERHFSDYVADPYEFVKYDGVKLNDAYRRLLFKAGKLDRRDYRFWQIWCVVRLRMLKRLLTGVRPLS